MKKTHIAKRTSLHLVLTLLAMAALTFWLFANVITHSYQERSLYTDAEIRFVNTPGVRASDFILKLDNSGFLLAPGAPQELKQTIEFTDAGEYTALVTAHYPDWLCEPHQLDKAVLRLNGGSANESIRLTRAKIDELVFTVAKGHKLGFKINNRGNNDCGRAEVSFYEVNKPLYFKIWFIALWASVLLLCLIAGASPYIAVFGILSNVLLLAADASLGVLATSNLVVNSGIALAVSGVLLLFSAVPLRSRIFSLLMLAPLIGLLLFPLAFIAYTMVFATPMTDEALHGAMQSYDSQMLEFWKEFIGKKRTLYMLFLLLTLYACVRHINLTGAKGHFAWVKGVLLVSVALAFVVARTDGSAISNLTMQSVIDYKWEIAAFKKIADQRKQVSTEAKRDSIHAQDTTVVVIGESVNKKFMSAYGYVQDTTPLLDKRIARGESILYRNVYSNHTHSNPTMSLILTQANQYNGQSWLESASVFNYARAAGVETNWLTNHRLLGGWSNHITTIINESDYLKTINYKVGIGVASTAYDEDLIPLYKKALAERPHQLTFLHLYNSHSFYCHRYPDSAKRFDIELPSNIYGELQNLRRTGKGLLGCYVNSIHYTDQVLEKLVLELEQRDNPSVLFYTADHSEEPIDSRTHNSAKFTFDMVNIPLFVWANDAWRAKHPKKWQNIIDNKNKVFSNDLAFESILGIAGITAPSIDLAKDISSSKYQSLVDPLTLHGRVEIKDPRNWNYWQSQNSAYAKNNGIVLVAGNVGSIGEAYVASTFNIRQIQINAQYSAETGLTLLSGNADQLTKMPLTDFLSAIQNRGFTAILLSLDSKALAARSKIEELLEKLSEQHSVSIILISKQRPNLADLSSLDFQQRHPKSDPIDKTLWVKLKSRFTDKPASLDE